MAYWAQMPCTPVQSKHRSRTIPLRYRCQMAPPSPVQLSRDALHTTTPTARSRTMHTYRRQMDPTVNWASMPCIPLHPLLDLGQCIYIEGRWINPSHLSIDDLHNTTPTARSRTVHIYRRQMDPPVNWAQMPCILLHPLLDPGQCLYIEGRWTPQSIKHRCLEYHYTSCGPPQSIEHRCSCILLHLLLDLGQCIYIEGRWTPSQSSIWCIEYHYTKYISIEGNGSPMQA